MAHQLARRPPLFIAVASTPSSRASRKRKTDQRGHGCPLKPWRDGFRGLKNIRKELTPNAHKYLGPCPKVPCKSYLSILAENYCWRFGGRCFGFVDWYLNRNQARNLPFLVGHHVQCQAYARTWSIRRKRLRVALGSGSHVFMFVGIGVFGLVWIVGLCYSIHRGHPFSTRSCVQQWKNILTSYKHNFSIVWVTWATCL